MRQYKLINNITGWAVFLIASYVYLMTKESTTSLWDCGEFIASAYKLEIGHPPGAPIFMIMGRFFSLFASDVSKVALMVNSLSALASSFSILFLFWSITHLARKIIIKKDEDFSLSKTIAIMGSALVGSLAYTFSDTFWFSAVEGEVYATSSLFTALVFWAMLKWENEADEPHANRWIILIAFLMGLSIGVHLLNLLAIPALVFIYYFKKYPVTRKGLIYTSLLSMVILGAMQYMIIPGIVKVASKFELMFVNGFGLPYNSGVFFYIFLVFGLIVWGIYYTHKHNKILLNNILLVFTVIIIGYSSFTIIVIRSQADPPMDENDPENFFSLLSYINREQYGDRPLVKGPYYNAPITGIEDKGKTYIPKDGKYVVSSVKKDYTYDERFTTVFPRMYSRRGDHVKAYQRWGKIKGISMKGEDGKVIKKPKFSENLRYFFRYQLGHMYVRYFMWNFAGRQNDEQGFGEILYGNWISGIPFIDKMLIGDQDKIAPKFLENKSRNTFFMLPFILGLIGLFFHYSNHKKDFTVTLLLFFFTGIAIILYLNQPPIEPRERDYTYAASFYAFAIWIGLGVLSIYNFLSKKLPKTASAVVATGLCFVLVPAVMAKENWDDHDRSGRYTARDMAYNYLNSCAPNAILFTNGDNDTFPLWYLQEVEGIRTDVRVVNLMLLNTDWHIKQCMRKAYESERLPISLPYEKYIEGNNNIIYLMDQLKNFVEIKRIIDFVASDDPKTKVSTQDNMKVDYIPTKNFILPVNKDKVLANGTVKKELADQIAPEIRWTSNKKYLTKSELCLLDILANNDWERPLYFVSPGNDNTLGLDNYLQNEGYAYRLVPVRSDASHFLDIGRIDKDILYDNMMNKFKWGRMYEDDVYLGHFDIRTLSVVRLRYRFHQLANVLIMDNQMDSAKLVLDKCMEIMPNKNVPYDYFTLDLIEDYYRINDTTSAVNISKEYFTITNDEVQYYLRLKKDYPDMMSQEINTCVHILRRLQEMARMNKQDELATELETSLRGLNLQ